MSTSDLALTRTKAAIAVTRRMSASQAIPMA
jgi:hypothetical protein